MTYPIQLIDRSRETQVEQLGSKPKVWLDDGQTLFKWDVRDTGAAWAEVVASQLCRVLGLPHVDYEFAALTESDRVIQPGVICPNIAPGDMELVLGNELLVAIDGTYPSSQRCKVREHTVDAVCQVLASLQKPAPLWASNAPEQVTDAIGFFIGYVMLDAWIANQDRHHENWGAIRDPSAVGLRLAPTFDHGAGLGSVIHDDERQARLTTRDGGYTIAAYCARAKSRFFTSAPGSTNLTALQAFERFAVKSPVETAAWLERLRAVTPDVIRGILEGVPGELMTPMCRDFTCRLLTTNRERILESPRRA
jgi:hypothetical protein